MGVELAFEPGPVVREPIRTMRRSRRCPELVPARDVPFVLESIRLVRAQAPRGVPLIGFAGAPFTLLCYLVCGRPSKEFAAARSVPVRASRTPPRACSGGSRTPWRSTLRRRRRPERRR